MRIGVILFFCILLVPNPAHAENALVIRITDGDTIVAKIGSVIERVRLIGIDAPERAQNGSVAQCYSKEATQDLKKMVSGKMVALARDPQSKNRDVYGRLLRMVNVQNGSSTLPVNSRLIEHGSARAYVRFVFSQSEQFKQKEKAAKTKKRGIWKACNKKKN